MLTGTWLSSITASCLVTLLVANVCTLNLEQELNGNWCTSSPNRAPSLSTMHIATNRCVWDFSLADAGKERVLYVCMCK